MLYSRAADNSITAVPLGIAMGSTDAVRIDTSGRVGIGSAVPNEKLTVADSGSANVYIALQNSTTGTTSADGWYLGAAGTEFQIYGKENGPITFSLNSSFGKSRSASVGGNTIVQSGDAVGSISFQGNDGSEFVAAASITAEVDGTPGANDMPGRLVFSTTADGASSPTERMRITSGGNIGIGTTSPASKLSVSDSSSVQIQATTGTVDFRIQSIDANSAAYSGTVYKS
jgi:hypothetical protein